MASPPLPPKLNVLFVDDDPIMRRYMRTQLQVEGHGVETASSGLEALKRLKHGLNPDLIFLDLLMPGLDGLQTLKQMLQLNPRAKVVILSCISDTRKVAQAIRAGALDYVTKPFGMQDLDGVLRPCLDLSGEQGLSELIEDLGDGTFFVAASSPMHKARLQAELVAKVDIPVLILGESGTGKEVLARLICRSSPRANGPFLKVNCAAIPDELLESELFGYEPGGFTGAVHARPGKFELCNKGTILLDEIGEMPSAQQAKLLHVLQDKEFSRLGGRSLIKVDVRIIATTNVDVYQALAQKTLREDLYYRLNGFTLQLPPLRERKQDIPLLLKHLMRRLSERYACPPLPFSKAVTNACLNYPWPGNVRELENFVKRSLLLGDVQLVASELKISAEAPARSRIASEANTTAGCDARSRQRVRSGLKSVARSAKAKAEIEAMLRALEQTNWNRKQAAKLLKISYKAMLYKIQQYDIGRPLNQLP